MLYFSPYKLSARYWLICFSIMRLTYGWFA